MKPNKRLGGLQTTTEPQSSSKGSQSELTTVALQYGWSESEVQTFTTLFNKCKSGLNLPNQKHYELAVEPSKKFIKFGPKSLSFADAVIQEEVEGAYCTCHDHLGFTCQYCKAQALAN
jgi:hypothetical protein